MSRHAHFVFAFLVLGGCMACAADPAAAGTFTAWNEGNFFPYFQQGGGQPTNGWGPQWDKVMGIDQEWTFGYAGAGYGFNATLEFGADNIGDTGAPQVRPPNISWFGTYCTFFDVMKVTLGKPRIGDYRPASFIEANGYTRFGEEEFGAFVEVTPMNGLTIAGALYVPNQDAFSVEGDVQHAMGMWSLGAGTAAPASLVAVPIVYVWSF
jgi:hypothetical protein